MSELLPCPFCGGEARVERDSFSGSFYVGCLNDECLGFSGLGWIYKKEEEAIEAWNTRVERTCHAVFDDSNWYKWICSECGQPIDRADNYCFSCGAKVTPTPL